MDTSTQEKLYTDEELQNIAGLIDVLQGIRRRLLSEGVPIDEIISKLHEDNNDV